MTLEIIVLVGAGVLMVGSFAWYGYMVARYVRRRRTYGRGPVPVREALAAAPAAVWLRGTVEPVGEALRAPLSGRECVLFVVGAEHRIVNAYYRRRATQRRDFAVRDDTGAAYVVAGEVDVVEMATDYIECERGTADADAIGDRLRQLGAVRPDSDGQYRALTVTETVLGVGEQVEIKGYAVRAPNPDVSAVSHAHGYRDAPERLLVQRCELRALRDRGDQLRAAAVLEG